MTASQGIALYQKDTRLLLREFCKRLREEKKLNKKQIAEEYGINPDTFRSWMRDKHTGGPSLVSHWRLLIDILFPLGIPENEVRDITPQETTLLLKKFRKENKGCTLEAFALYASVCLNTCFLWEKGIGSPSLNKHFLLVVEFMEWMVGVPSPFHPKRQENKEKQ